MTFGASTEPLMQERYASGGVNANGEEYLSSVNNANERRWLEF
jgi:hypothetical protein